MMRWPHRPSRNSADMRFEALGRHRDPRNILEIQFDFKGVNRFQSCLPCVPGVDHSSLIDLDGRRESSFGENVFHLAGREYADIATVGGPHVLDAFGRGSVPGHQGEPCFEKVLAFGLVEIARQVGGDQDALGGEAFGDAFEESGAGFLIKDEVGDEDGSGGIERFALRKRVEVADMAGAAGSDSGFLRTPLEYIEHRRGGFDGGEMPMGEFFREIDDLVAGSCSYTENPGIRAEIGKHRTRKQMQCGIDGCELAPLLVIGGGLLVE